MSFSRSPGATEVFTSFNNTIITGYSITSTNGNVQNLNGGELILGTNINDLKIKKGNNTYNIVVTTPVPSNNLILHECKPIYNLINISNWGSNFYSLGTTSNTVYDIGSGIFINALESSLNTTNLAYGYFTNTSISTRNSSGALGAWTYDFISPSTSTTMKDYSIRLANKYLMTGRSSFDDDSYNGIYFINWQNVTFLLFRINDSSESTHQEVTNNYFGSSEASEAFFTIGYDGFLYINGKRFNRYNTRSGTSGEIGDIYIRRIVTF